MRASHPIKPLFHFVMITLAFLQWSDYLRTYDYLNKFMNLLTTAIIDIRGFMVIFFWFLVYFNLTFFVIGATFDDGGTYDEEYDTAHNDFPKLDQFWVYVLQVFRTSVGDLQPPSYDYWGARYDNDDGVWAHFMIGLIWLLWLLQIVVIVICALNFLIAIVSDSYNQINEREQLSQIESREDICTTTMYEVA